jgi:uncharacterized protein YjbI with pentapeptide repeats
MPPLPSHVPQYDDEEAGFSFFRTMLDDGEDLRFLSLPRTFFGRSLIKAASFEGSDLTESNLCWNDFEGTIFSGACLAAADMRASQFINVSFKGCDLRGADLRQSYFKECLFESAQMAGALLTNEQAAGMALSSSQRAEINCCIDAGPEPGGG